MANRSRWQIGYQSPGRWRTTSPPAMRCCSPISGQFRSASGVLHLAAHYRKPMIASAGASALLDTVRSFGLGVVVQSDQVDLLVVGIRRLLSDPPPADWQGYGLANSWDRNAELVAQALSLSA